jgi:AcrR family transcriptional regulator
VNKRYDAPVEKAKSGRPRTFDADAALEKAMVVFWEQGYEGASLTDLTEAMGIARKSMYAAFGNKEELFRKVLQRYLEGPASYILEALQASTAREVAEEYLSGAVRASTWPGYPTGCLGVQGALATGATGQIARDTLVEWRATVRAHLRHRFQRAVDDGDLPADADPEHLARYVTTIGHGLTVEAAGDGTREDLRRVAVAALRHWPPAED